MTESPDVIIGEVLPDEKADGKKKQLVPRKSDNVAFGSFITKSNDLIQRTKYSLPRNEQKILFMMLSKIDQRHDMDASKYYTIHVLDYSANTGSTFHSGHLPLLLRYWVASSCRSPQALAISVIYTLIVLIINYLRAKRKSVSVIHWRSDGKGLSFCDIRNVVSVCVQDVNGSFLLPRRKFAQLFAQFVICHMGCGWNGIPNKHICGYTQHLNDSDKGFQFRDFYSAL